MVLIPGYRPFPENTVKMEAKPKIPEIVAHFGNLLLSIIPPVVPKCNSRSTKVLCSARRALLRRWKNGKLHFFLDLGSAGAI
jgi:hypothetical protein